MKNKRMLVYRIELAVDPENGIDVAAMRAALEPFGKVTVVDWATRKVNAE